MSMHDMSGLADEDGVITGNRAGAQYLARGQYHRRTTRRSETTVVGAGTKRAQVTATASLRPSTRRQEVVLAATGRSRKNNTLVKAPLGLIRIGTEQVDKEQVNEAPEDAIHDAVDGPRGSLARMDGKARSALISRCVYKLCLSMRTSDADFIQATILADGSCCCLCSDGYVTSCWLFGGPSGSAAVFCRRGAELRRL